MKAIVYRRYGSPDVLELIEMGTPVVADDQVLIRVHAASVNPIDWHYMRGRPYLVRTQAGVGKPKDIRVGVDVAGRVEAVGKNVKEFKPGDEVFGAANGSLAECVCATERSLVPKPVSVTFEQAAAVAVASFTALQGLRDKGRIQPGQKILINGAAGGVGTFAVQVAKSFGAEVTGVCSTRNVEMVRSIGADQVIDYTREDFTRRGQRYDLMFDMIGNHSFADCRRALTPDGTLVMVGAANGGLMRTARGAVLSRFVSQKLLPFLAHWSKEDLKVMQRLLETGKVMPVIDRTYPLDQVPEAIRYLEGGHARGKVVITV